MFSEALPGDSDVCQSQRNTVTEHLLSARGHVHGESEDDVERDQAEVQDRKAF